VSGYTWILSSAIQQRWNQAVRTDLELETSSPREDPFTKWLRSFSVKRREWLESFWIVQKSQELYHNSHFHRIRRRTEESPPEAFAWPAWLIGKQPEDDEITPTTRRLECANQILLAGSDAQTFTGGLLMLDRLWTRLTALRYCLTDQCSHSIQDFNFLPYAYII
jgi:hypothetical protein